MLALLQRSGSGSAPVVPLSERERRWIGIEVAPVMDGKIDRPDVPMGGRRESERREYEAFEVVVFYRRRLRAYLAGPKQLPTITFLVVPAGAQVSPLATM